jgi:hypothetical protein
MKKLKKLYSIDYITIHLLYYLSLKLTQDI